MNVHEIASAWSVYKYQARRGDFSVAALARHGRELIATTSPNDPKAQRYLDLVLIPEMVEIERRLGDGSEPPAVAA
jgi:hypothetical protein